MIPVMDWTAGGTLGSEAGEYEGGGVGSQEVSANGTVGGVTGPMQACACLQCHQEDTEQVKAIKTSCISAPTHFKKLTLN